MDIFWAIMTGICVGLATESVAWGLAAASALLSFCSGIERAVRCQSRWFKNMCSELGSMRLQIEESSSKSKKK